MRNSFGKLKWLSVVGYKSIQKMDRLELADINIVIGPNGVGKSNFTNLFRFLSYLARGDTQGFIARQGGIDKFLHFGRKQTEAAKFSLVSSEHRYEFTLGVYGGADLRFMHERFDNYANIARGREEAALGQGDLADPLLRRLSKHIADWRVYHFHDTSENSPLRGESDLTEPEILSADGGNLPAFLYYLQERYPEHLDYVLDAVKEVAPFFGSFVLRPEALNEKLIRLRWRHVGHDALFDAYDLSDGTLRFIALAALLLQPEPPDTIVLDEPELGLHPAAVTQLAALIHQVSPTVQIIAATQSPTFANHFGWQDFIVADRVGDASRFRRLSKREVAPWAAEFGMGEIWEKNLIGGRP